MMQRHDVKHLFKVRLYYLAVILLVAANPMALYASTSPPQASTSSTNSQPTETEEEDNSYHYNEETGMWENDDYIWDPNTNQTKPKNSQDYSYNPETGMWDTTDYYYDSGTGQYEPNKTVTAKDPEGDSTVAKIPELDPESSAGPTAQTASASQSDPEEMSSSEIEKESSSSGTFDLFYDASISNNVYSSASSGDATVQGNTAAGSALTGDAQVIATLINMLQSGWDPSGSEFATFIANIEGDVNGDLVVDPSAGSDATTVSAVDTPSGNTELEVDVNNTGQINNDVELSATSGNAAVTENTSAGDATTGTATVMANIVNMINSIIAAGQSFLGLLNIYGDFNGDILLPADFVEYLLASNIPATSVTVPVTGNGETDVDVTNDQTINNNVTATANSGQATVEQNTSAGDATTGNASTSVTIFNLASAQVTAANALIVFVNVLGEWIGFILDAPADTTAAMLGGGEGGTLTKDTDGTASYDIENNFQINNNINLNAQSGDATVANNTLAGDATTGDAYASVNLLNVINSQFSISDWFGVLFINVFGDWFGGIGILPEESKSPPSDEPMPQPPPVFRFIPGPKADSEQSAVFFGPGSAVSYVTDTISYVTANNDTGVLSETTGSSPADQNQTEAATPNNRNWLVVLLGVVLSSVLLGTERVIAARRQSQNLQA